MRWYCSAEVQFGCFKAFELLVQMSDHLSPLWNTYLTNEVQRKLFLENYLRARSPDVTATAPQAESPPLHTKLGRISGCQVLQKPVRRGSERGRPLSRHLSRSGFRTLSSGAWTFVQRLHELRGVPWPSLAVWADEQREHFVFLQSSGLEPAVACVFWLVLTLCDCSPSENKTVSSFSPSGTKNLGEKLAVLLCLNNTETDWVDLDFACRTDFLPWMGLFFFFATSFLLQIRRLCLLLRAYLMPARASLHLLLSVMSCFNFDLV